ncbi:MAG: hypothetical protein HRU09_16480 [Oligoflexales bacterium]|nr:hypothetical protein [Oligoflexales bacterium]
MKLLVSRIVVSALLFTQITTALIAAPSSNLVSTEPEMVDLNTDQKRNIEYLILRDRFKTVIPKLLVGLGIFSGAVPYDYYQKAYGADVALDQDPEDVNPEEVYTMSKAAYHMVERALGNQFFLGTMCASFGGEGIRATFDGAEYLLGRLIGARNLDSQSEIDRKLLT